MPLPSYPSYYNPYMSAYPTPTYAPQVSTTYYNPPTTMMPQQPQYMINIDGENSAKAWQPTVVPQPNTIIPLFDSDGEHVYFKTYDAYGRMNPLRKGRIVFDDEIHVSETAQAPDMSQYVTKEDFESLRKEIQNLKPQNNQNGSNFQRGEKR